jgi:hypothetical protein
MIKQAFVFKYWIMLLVPLLLITACTNQDSSEKKVTGIRATEGENVADIIRNPVTANEQAVDTSELARMVFAEEVFDFGEVDAGAVVNHTFTFTNAGKVPLVISDVRSTCGCTVAEWPKTPISPGQQGKIPVRFDTKNKTGVQGKPITITANTYPSKTVIYLNGKVFGEAKPGQ